MYILFFGENGNRCSNRKKSPIITYIPICGLHITGIMVCRKLWPRNRTSVTLFPSWTTSRGQTRRRYRKTCGTCGDSTGSDGYTTTRTRAWKKWKGLYGAN